MWKGYKLMREQWIDCGKFLAISAVVVDHVNGFLYTNPLIALSSYFSVTLFVLLSGVTAFYSNQNHISDRWSRLTYLRIRSIFAAFAIATAVYQLLYEKMFDFKTYLMHVLNFDAIAPFYFVAFYIQLVILSPLLHRFVIFFNKQRHPLLYHGVFIFILLCVSAFSIRYTNMFNIHGGGKYLFGGTYLPLYYFGMLFASRQTTYWTDSKMKMIFFSVLTGGLLLGWFIFMSFKAFVFDAYLPFGYGFNPPSMTLGIYGLLWFVFIFYAFNLINRIKNRIIIHITDLISMGGGPFTFSCIIWRYIMYCHFSLCFLQTYGSADSRTSPVCL
jgi:hypothetical protein